MKGKINKAYVNVTMEAKPLQVVPSSNNTSGGGPQKKIDMGQGMEESVVFVDDDDDVVVGVKKKNKKKKKKKNSSSSSCVEIDVVGVGADDTAHTETKPEEREEKEEERGAINPVIKACQHQHHQHRLRCFLFTEAQRRELDHQVLIFNHFAYNIPLPHHLVLPFISTASVAGVSNFHNHKQFPSYMSEYSRRGFDYGSMVDPELHRCRRTDGKKWRCGKNVVPDQKYCERHMHRGRNCSRKPVEISEVFPLVTKPSSKLHTILASKTESAVSSPSPLGIQLNDTSSCTPSWSISIAKTSSTNNRLKHVVDSADYNTAFSPRTAVSAGSTLGTAVAPKVTKFGSRTLVVSDNRSSLNICKKDNQTKSCMSNNTSVRSGGRGNISFDSNCISTGIGFSPRSVLHGNIVSGCNSSYLNDRNSIDLEPGRCRRTDGKKWRCKSAVLPGQKYCATHMHRGAKRRFTDHEPVTATTSSAITDARLPCSRATTTDIQKAYCAIPNTNLSMSIPARAPLTQRNEGSPSGSSDTDTTITDTMNEYSYASF